MLHARNKVTDKYLKEIRFVTSKIGEIRGLINPAGKIFVLASENQLNKYIFPKENYDNYT